MTKTKTKNRKYATILSKEHFHTFYLISHILPKFWSLNDKDQEYIYVWIENFAQKIVAISKKLIFQELKHAKKGGDKHYCVYKYSNPRIIKRILKRNFREVLNKQSITIEEAIKIFKLCDWHPEYGGAAWESIARGAKKVDDFLAIFDEQTLKNVVVAIDHVIDLWHNNDLYLNEYCDFELSVFLDWKSKKASPKDFIHADKRIINVYERTYGEKINV